MSKVSIILISVLIGFIFAGEEIKPKFLAETIKLPEPKKTGGMPLYDAMSARKSERNFVNEDLSQEQLSQLLWSAYGPNRADLKKTAASSRGMYPFDIYAFTSKGVFKYLPNTNELEVISNRDFRGITGTQDFIPDVSVNIAMVSVLEREKDLPDVATMKIKCDLDTGHAVQNMLMFAASEGLKCVPRGMFVEGGILEVLGLDSQNYYIPLCVSIGK